jgi:PhoPQ-activated pathogenicity-related protein
MPLFIVETITTFRHYYAIECESAEHAEDTVVMQEAQELDQKCLGETIVSTREITTKEFYQIAKDSMNGHLAEKMIHKVDYGNPNQHNHTSNVDGYV